LLPFFNGIKQFVQTILEANQLKYQHHLLLLRYGNMLLPNGKIRLQLPERIGGECFHDGSIRQSDLKLFLKLKEMKRVKYRYTFRRAMELEPRGGGVSYPSKSRIYLRMNGLWENQLEGFNYKMELETKKRRPLAEHP